MYIIATCIDWDTEGIDLRETGLPNSVLVVGCPVDDKICYERLANLITEEYHFMHYGFHVVEVMPSEDADDDDWKALPTDVAGALLYTDDPFFDMEYQ